MRSSKLGWAHADDRMQTGTPVLCHHVRDTYPYTSVLFLGKNAFIFAATKEEAAKIAYDKGFRVRRKFEYNSSCIIDINGYSHNSWLGLRTHRARIELQLSV
jgi:hypothetical protein